MPSGWCERGFAPPFAPGVGPALEQRRKISIRSRVRGSRCSLPPARVNPIDPSVSDEDEAAPSGIRSTKPARQARSAADLMYSGQNGREQGTHGRCGTRPTPGGPGPRHCTASTERAYCVCEPQVKKEPATELWRRDEGGADRQPGPLVLDHDAATREVEFNERFLAFAAYWGFRPRAPICRGRRAGLPTAAAEPRADGSPNRRADHTLGGHMPARERHRAASRGHGHHVVDPPPATFIGTRQSCCEAGLFGDIVAVVELPAAQARTDRAPAESEDGVADQCGVISERLEPHPRGLRQPVARRREQDLVAAR